MNLDATLTLLSREPSAPVDLAELALHLAQDEYPELDVEAYLGELDAMAHEARSYLGGGLQSQVHGLCRYLFHEMGFHGNTRNYYDPRNSYLNQVLDRRTGIPISLALVAMAVGNRAGLEVVGVGLPGHFVAKAVAGDEALLFDPFHGGRSLAPESCEQLVERVTGRPFRATSESLKAIPRGWMVQRILNNLKGVYLSSSDFARAGQVIRRLVQLCPHDPQQRRDLGFCLVRAGQPGQAIEHLKAYLNSAPHSADLDTVRQMLEQAKSEVARWN